MCTAYKTRAWPGVHALFCLTCDAKATAHLNFAIATVTVGEHNPASYGRGKMNSAFWRARPNQRDGCNDHQTLRRFVHCPLYGVYRCGLDWHCVDIALSLIETMTVAFGSIRYYRTPTQNNRSTSASIAGTNRPAVPTCNAENPVFHFTPELL